MSRNLLLLGVIGLAAGCSVGSSSRSAPSSTTFVVASTVSRPEVPPPLTLTVYGPNMLPRPVRVPPTRAVAAAALHALGVDAPVSVADGKATVRLAHASDPLVARIVLTLTQLPSVRRVDVAGHAGLTRADVLPPIEVEQPTAGATVPPTFTVSGSAAVYEATLVVELRRDGSVLERRTVTASAGAPARGRFSTTLQAPSGGRATVAAFAPSAADGSPQHEQDVDVVVR